MNRDTSDLPLFVRLLRQVITGRLPASRLRVKTHDGRYIQVAKVVDLGNGVYDIIPVAQ